MRRQIDQLRRLASRGRHVFYAGDIFHKWKVSPELINFAIRHLPKGYAVPGQHDLPYHRYEDIRKSAYWTLVEAGVIKNLKPGEPVSLPIPSDNEGDTAGILVYGFPWGWEPKPLPPKTKPVRDFIRLAVVHGYCWCEGWGDYPGAQDSGHLSNRIHQLKGFDAVVFGDNHRGFLATPTGGISTYILNNGSFIPRNSDERYYRPAVGLLHKSGRIERHHLPTDQDKWLDEATLKDMKTKKKDFSKFVEDLEALGDSAFDFAEAAVKAMRKRKDLRESVREFILEALED